MTVYDDTNRGALFNNDRKETENHPDFKGQINVGGAEYWLSGWRKKSKAGDGYISLSIQPKKGRGDKPQGKAASSTIDEDDIQF